MVINYLSKKKKMSVEFKTTKKYKTPIKRNSKFFSPEDFNLELEFGREYVEGDLNQTVILYQVDLEKTKVNDIYKEAEKDAIRFKAPIEIPVIYTLEEGELSSYDKKTQKGYYVKPGKLTFTVYIQTLINLDCDIKRGDYIGVQVTPEHMEYYTVSDDGRISSYANKNTLFGTVPVYRNITAVYVDKNEFQG